MKYSSQFNLKSSAKSVTTDGQKPVHLRNTLRRHLRTIWQALRWPDYACGWIFPALAMARKLCQSKQFDWVITVSHPFTGHMVGWLLHRHMQGARWLVDIGDPFSLMDDPSPNNYRLYSRVNKWIESRVLSLSDAISVTTQSTLQIYEKNFPVVSGKTYIIPPLLSLPDVSHTGKLRLDDTIHLIFVGTLYKKLRNPQFLMKCVSALKRSLHDVRIDRRIELHFYGAVNDCAAELDACTPDIRENVFVHGLVERGEVMSAMMNANILVNIGNDSETQLASKVIEYMSIGKPVLNLVSHDRDLSVDALAEYPAVLTLRRDQELNHTIVDALRDFVLSPPTVSMEVVAMVRDKYSVARVAADYASILHA
jgi:glycosyltransferase involved in cell wall biosynthesis